MTEAEAYGDRSYATRASAEYEPGQFVRVGPAYRMGGNYICAGDEGLYYVVARIGRSPDYKLAHVWSNGSYCADEWDVIVHASRLMSA